MRNAKKKYLRFATATSAAALIAFTALPAHGSDGPEDISAIAGGATLTSDAPDEVGTDNSIEPTSTSEMSGIEQDDGSLVYTGEEAELTITPPEEGEQADIPAAAMQPTFGCSLNVQNVHPSAHYPGTINGVAIVDCNIDAGSIALHYSLIRVSPNNQQWAAGSVSNSGESSLQTNRAVSCDQGPGDFQGWAQDEITAPAGYVLDGSPIREQWGNTSYVNCNSTTGSSVEEGELTERITVHFVRADLVE